MLNGIFVVICVFGFVVTGRKAKKEAQRATSRIPNLKDHDEMQRFFLQEVNSFDSIFRIFFCKKARKSTFCLKNHVLKLKMLKKLKITQK